MEKYIYIHIKFYIIGFKHIMGFFTKNLKNSIKLYTVISYFVCTILKVDDLVINCAPRSTAFPNELREVQNRPPITC